MNFPEKDNIKINRIIEEALLEDIWTGDITTESIIPPYLHKKAIIIAKEEGIIAGLEVANLVFKKLDSAISFQKKVEDGSIVKPYSTVVEISGAARTILQGERVALNFLQRMSGIATTTFKFCQEVKDFPVQIVDTRKTIPGIRILDKYAVRVGGGKNHRFGLYDAVLIKDNHIAVAGSIASAINSVRAKISPLLKIEIEIQNLSQLQEALETKVDIVMLDNMDLEMMKQAVKIARGKTLIEASGGITLDKVKEIAEIGVDFISVGSLTHSVKALDLSLEII